MNISVDPASPDERDIIFNLLQYYLHNFSEFEDDSTDEQGMYDYPYLDFYWSESARLPFLIRLNDNIAGFALVRTDMDPRNGEAFMDMAEFFVLRVYRKQGVGNFAARDLWNRFPGFWHVSVLNSNKAAYPFWKNAIESYTRNQYSEEADTKALGRAVTFVFSSSPASVLV